MSRRPAEAAITRYFKQNGAARAELGAYKTIGKAGTAEVRDCRAQGHITVCPEVRLLLLTPGAPLGATAVTSPSTLPVAARRRVTDCSCLAAVGAGRALTHACPQGRHCPGARETRCLQPARLQRWDGDGKNHIPLFTTAGRCLAQCSLTPSDAFGI